MKSKQKRSKDNKLQLFYPFYPQTKFGLFIYQFLFLIAKLTHQIDLWQLISLSKLKTIIGQVGRIHLKSKETKKITKKTGVIFAQRHGIKKIAVSENFQVILSIIVSVSILYSSYYVYVQIFKDLPSATKLTQREQIVTTKILDRNGNLLFRIYKDENRSIIPLSQVPRYMVDATIAIEDKNYYHHFGFDLSGITRAIISNLKGERVQGGSTITQQLVKNTLLSPEKTLQRKIKELILAILVDATYSKDEILQIYFNEIPYGGSIYGVEEASQKFFGKNTSQLTLAESAMLAGLPQSPSTYSPYGANPDRAYLRQAEVLRRMVEDGYITLEQAEEAKKEKLAFQKDVTNIFAPHFVMYVKDILAQKYGEQMLTQGGLEVTTSLDLTLQNISQQAVVDELNKLSRMNVTNGAVLVTNPQTGEILSMVGSKDYFDFAHDGQVNVTTRPRQPGSSIKPLTYATAFERTNFNPSTIIDDRPVSYQLAGSPAYTPVNYDGKYHGKVTVRESLGSSYNIPAVKTLAQVGVDNLIDKAEKMGITTWGDRKRFGLSLTLGGGEVLMTDMAQVYGTFATYGYTVDLNPILEIKNYKGEIIYQNTCVTDQTKCPRSFNLDPRIAYQITDILSDNKARTPAFGPASVLYVPGQQIAVKTGTTNSLRDNWTIGYTTNRLVAVWVGNNDNSPMSYVASGITGASPIWNTVIRSMLSEDQPHYFPQPTGLIKVKICKTTGTLPCSACPSLVEEYFIPGTQPKTACSEESFKKKIEKLPRENIR